MNLYQRFQSNIMSITVSKKIAHNRSRLRRERPLRGGHLELDATDWYQLVVHLVDVVELFQVFYGFVFQLGVEN